MSRTPTLLWIACMASGLPFSSQALSAQDEAPKKIGTIFKSEVDAGIRVLMENAGEDGSLGNGSCVQTAKVLTAMGFCHRFYAMSDGPRVRKAVTRLFNSRRSDGSFADVDENAVATTYWVRHALEQLAPQVHAQEIERAKTWLRDNAKGETDPWEGLLETSMDEVLRAGDAIKAGDKPAESAQAIDTPVGVRVQALLETVSIQVVARRMDKLMAEEGATTWTAAQQGGFDFLLTQQVDGAFSVFTEQGRFTDTGLTGMGLAALQTKPESQRTVAERKIIRDGLAYLLAEQNEDGSVGKNNLNYSTCAAILALSMTPTAEHKQAMLAAQKYILRIQNTEDRDYSESDRDYGSIGYGGDQRGDLSNLQFAIEALRKSGLQEDHEALAKALVFMQRTQNLREVNDYKERVRDGADGSWYEVTSGDDGGAAYYPGNSAAGYIELGDGTRIPRSYGSMTYALLKTYILCGLKADDRRVQAAVQWIEKNWTLDENPGSSPSLGEKAKYQGLYYYYMVLAQALDIAEMDSLKTGEAAESLVDWRKELRAHLESLQTQDGYWLNEKNGRWWESQAGICTIYALLALDRCKE